MKGTAVDKINARTGRSLRIESAINVLSEVLGSRNEVIATIASMLVSDPNLTDRQREQIKDAMYEMCGESYETCNNNLLECLEVQS